jgi:hypothetical protein
MASRKSLITIKSKPAGQPSPTGTLNTILLPSSSMNRKAWRKARKSATKTVGDIVVSDAEDQTETLFQLSAVVLSLAPLSSIF